MRILKRIITTRAVRILCWTVVIMIANSLFLRTELPWALFGSGLSKLPQYQLEKVLFDEYDPDTTYHAVVLGDVGFVERVRRDSARYTQGEPILYIAVPGFNQSVLTAIIKRIQPLAVKSQLWLIQNRPLFWSTNVYASGTQNNVLWQMEQRRASDIWHLAVRPFFDLRQTQNTIQEWIATQSGSPKLNDPPRLMHNVTLDIPGMTERYSKLLQRTTGRVVWVRDNEPWGEGILDETKEAFLAGLSDGKEIPGVGRFHSYKATLRLLGATQ